jgi:hypothetical protein
MAGQAIEGKRLAMPWRVKQGRGVDRVEPKWVRKEWNEVRQVSAVDQGSTAQRNTQIKQQENDNFDFSPTQNYT